MRYLRLYLPVREKYVRKTFLGSLRYWLPEPDK
jgi:hypothetical protein